MLCLGEFSLKVCIVSENERYYIYAELYSVEAMLYIMQKEVKKPVEVLRCYFVKLLNWLYKCYLDDY